MGFSLYTVELISEYEIGRSDIENAQKLTMIRVRKQFLRCLGKHLNECKRNQHTQISERTRKEIHKAIYSCREIIFEPLEIRSAKLGTSFTNAHLDVDICKENKNVTSQSNNSIKNACNVRFSTMYSSGFEILKSLLEVSNNKQKTFEFFKDREIVKAVRSLEIFVSDLEKHQKSLSMTNPAFDEEGAKKAVIANHLIGKLCGGDYIISHDMSLSSKYGCCPCSPSCQEIIKYDRIGLGHPSLWYGYPDIIALPQNFQNGCCLTVENTNDCYIYEDNDSQPIELQVKSVRETMDTMQIIAQTITSSFCRSACHHQQHPDWFPVEVSLIPTVAISADEMDVYMYDYKHDILLRGVEPIVWSRGDRLELTPVIYLWMILHHAWLQPRFMMSELAELEGSAGFQSLSDVRCNVEIFKTETTYRSGVSIDKLMKEEIRTSKLQRQLSDVRFAEKSEYEELKRRTLLV